MGVFLAIISFLGLCFLCQRLFRVSIASCPVRTLSFIILVLYAFAYFSSLFLGVLCVIVTGSIAFAYASYTLIQERDQHSFQSFSPSVVFWMLLTTVTAFFFSQQSFTAWDEFMHWAPLAKIMNQRGDLLYGDAPIVHASYPPAARLWYNFFLFQGRFNEAFVYIAQAIFLCAPLLLIFRDYTKKYWKRAFIISAFMFEVLFFLLNTALPVTSLYLDVPIGFYVGAIVTCYFQSQKRPTDIIGLAPIIGMLILLKPQLFSFVLLIVMILFFDQCIRKKISVTSFFSLLSLILIAGIIHYTWVIHLQYHNIPLEWNSKGFGSLFEFFTAIFHPTNIDVFNYIKKTIFLILPIITLWIYASLLLPFTQKNAVDRRALCIANLTWFIGFLMYLFALSGFFLTLFPYYYANALERYLSIYLIAWGFFISENIVTFFYEKKIVLSYRNKKILFFILCGLLILGLSAYLIKTKNEAWHGRAPWQLRQALLPLSRRVIQQTPSTSKIFIVWQHSSGLGRVLLIYDLFPRRCNTTPSSFGAVTQREEVGWKMDATPAQFISLLKEFDYILLAHIDDEFLNRYGRMFDLSSPLAHYSTCEGIAFDSLLKPTCVLKTFGAYLFKIETLQDRVFFIPIRNEHD